MLIQKREKGYTFAESKPREFHGVGEFDIGTGNTNQSAQLSFTDAFGKALVSLAENNDRICAITAAMGQAAVYPASSLNSRNDTLMSELPSSMPSHSRAVLQKNGFLPVFAVYSTFLQRACDQIIHDVSLQNLKVIFAVDRAGIVGDDGETHQGLFDIPMLLPIPNIVIFSPSTGTELSVMLERAVNSETKSCVIRYPRGNCIEYTDLPFKNAQRDRGYPCKRL